MIELRASCFVRSRLDTRRRVRGFSILVSGFYFTVSFGCWGWLDIAGWEGDGSAGEEEESRKIYWEEENMRYR